MNKGSGASGGREVREGRGIRSGMTEAIRGGAEEREGTGEEANEMDVLKGGESCTE